MWEVRTAVVHDGFAMDSVHIERLCWTIDVDIREVRVRFDMWSSLHGQVSGLGKLDLLFGPKSN